MKYQIVNGNCLNVFADLKKNIKKIDLTFLDPPFNQQKNYRLHNDNMNEKEYWQMMKSVCLQIFQITSEGGAIYFMQREKNTEFVLNTLRETGWSFQNLIIWKKKTSAVPVPNKFGKQYQVIGYATKGNKARVFNRLRINPELPSTYKYKRENGIFITDVWDDIRELTSGFFAGNEAIRHKNGERFHKQQSPIALLLRIILTSSSVGDTILDPFAGTGTAPLVAQQLKRNSVAIEVDPANVELIKKRISAVQEFDLIQKYYKDYIYTEKLPEIWGHRLEEFTKSEQQNTLSLFN